MRVSSSRLAALIASVMVWGGIGGRAIDAATEFDASGMPTLSLNRGEPFAVRSVVLADGEGKRESVRAEPERFALSEDGSKLTAHHGWGRVVCTYRRADGGDRLEIAIEVTNTSQRTIHEIDLVPAKIRLGEGVRGGGSHHNIGAPTVITLRAADRSAAVCNTDVEQPLTVGVGKARHGVAEVRVQAGGDKMVYDELYLRRPIAPGNSDRYELSIRIGAAGDNPHELASDIYKKFAEAHPRKLNWPDRRPITQLFFGGGAPKEKIIAHFRDPDEHPKPEAGDAKRQEGLEKAVQRGVEAAQAVNAQGIIFWDIEGNSFKHPTTYIGDPRLVGVFNPDFDAVADALFKTVTDAGLLAGVCIRPTQIVYKKKKDTVGHAFTPVLEAHDEQPVVEQLAKKIKYARDRWGCRIFYVDTNFVWRPREPDGAWAAGMIQAEVWRKLLDRFPDILIVPEFGYPEYHAYMPVYAEYDMGYKGVKPGVRRIYPEAFNVTVIEDADPYENYDLMTRNVGAGDVLMTFAYGLTRNARAMRHMDTEAGILETGAPRGMAEMTEAELIALMDAEELRDRFYASRTLATVGGAASAGALRRAAASADRHWLVRKNAIVSLGQRGERDAIDVLLPLLEKRKPDLRYFAAEALGRIGRPALEPVMDRIGQGRYFVLAAGMIGDPAAAEKLIELIEQQGPQRESLRALGRVGGPEAVKKLTAVLHSDRGFLRVAAAEALGEIGTPEAVGALVAARQAEAAKPKNERFGHLIWAIGRTLRQIHR